MAVTLHLCQLVILSNITHKNMQIEAEIEWAQMDHMWFAFGDITVYSAPVN